MAMEINSLQRVNSAVAYDPFARMFAQSEVPDTVIRAVRALNRSELLGNDRELHFARDRNSHAVVIRILDRKTGEVLDQIPPEQVLHILADLNQEPKEE